MAQDNNHNQGLKCAECGGTMIEKEGTDPEGFPYKFYSCQECGYEFLTKEQLFEAAEAYKTMKKYNVKVSKWGTSLGMRIPKELAREKDIDENSELVIIPEEKGFKIMKG